MSSQQSLFYNRPTTIAAAVVLLHAGGLVALQTGLLRHAAEIVVPVRILSALIEPPQPMVEPPPAQPKPTPSPAPQPKVAQKPPTPPPAPQPLATKDTSPAPATPLGNTTPAPPIEVAQAPAAPSAPPSPTAAPSAAPPAPPSSSKVELPSSDADYLNNPPPAYPPMSRKLGEAGKVVVRVYISPDGTAQKAELRTSSGFERLDAAAIAAALKWRYAPGKRGGVPEAMWVNVPIAFTLD
jgi:periplasmic protein TonB